jgi:hypothetical protein
VAKLAGEAMDESRMPSSNPEPYIAALGDTAARLPMVVLDLHRFRSPARYSGRACVTRGANPLARMITSVMRLPAFTGDCAVEVGFTRDAQGVETWTRTFGTASFSSTHALGRGRWTGLVVERFGPVAVAMAVMEHAGRLRLVVRGWSIFAMPMPLLLGPRVAAFEHGDCDRFNFDVSISLPLLGLVMHYRGWLVAAACTEPS